MDHNPFQALSQRARRDARRNAKKDDIGLDEETLLAPFQAFKMDNIGLDKETLKLATLLEREAHEPRAPHTSSPGSEDAPADILQNQAASQDDARLNRNTMRPFFCLQILRVPWRARAGRNSLYEQVRFLGRRLTATRPSGCWTTSS